MPGPIRNLAERGEELARELAESLGEVKQCEERVDAAGADLTLKEFWRAEVRDAREESGRLAHEVAGVVDTITRLDP